MMETITVIETKDVSGDETKDVSGDENMNGWVRVLDGEQVNDVS